MGLADLFKAKSSKLKPDPRVRWFGKLPSYGDYYRSNTDEAWAVEFNDWVLKGIEVYQRQRSADPSRSRRHGRLPLAGCMVRLPKSGMTVLASVQDYGGDMRGRPFPLCFYVGVPTAAWPGPTSNRLAAAARTVRDLMGLRREVVRFLNSPGRFEDYFGEHYIDLSGLDGRSEDDSWVEKARKITMPDWIAAVQSDLQIEDPRAWLHLIGSWGERIAQLESKTFEPTLRFPLAPGIPLEVQMAGWIRWLELRMDLNRRVASLMVSGELERVIGHLSVVVRELSAEDFLLLTDLAGAHSCVDSLADVKAVGGESESAAPGTAVPAPAGSWADFVEGAGAAA